MSKAWDNGMNYEFAKSVLNIISDEMMDDNEALERIRYEAANKLGWVSL